MRSRLTAGAPWALILGASLVLVEHWQPWARVIGVIMLVGWMILLGGFVNDRLRRRPRK